MNIHCYHISLFLLLACSGVIGFLGSCHSSDPGQELLVSEQLPSYEPDSLNSAARQLHDQGYYRKALHTLHLAKNAYELQQDTSSQIIVLMDQAGVLFAVGAYDSARQACRDAEILFEQAHYEREDPLQVRILGFLAGYEAQIRQNWELGKDLIQQARAIQLSKVGLKHEQTAIVFFDLAQFFQVYGRMDSALYYTRKGLQLQQQYSATQKSLRAIGLNILGATHYWLANFDSTKYYANAAIAWRQQHLPVTHPDMANDLNLLALAEERLGNFPRYRNLTLKAISHFQQSTLKDEVPSQLLQLLHHNLGTLYADLGKSDSSLYYFHTAYELGKVIFGEDGPELGSTLSNMGMVQLGQDAPHLALSLNKEALRLQQSIGNQIPFEIANTHNALGACFRELGNYDSAWVHFLQAWNIRSEFLQALDPDRAFSLAQLGSIALKLDRAEEAIHFLLESANIYKQQYGSEEISSHARVYQLLALAHFQQEKFIQAKTWAKRSHHIYLQSPFANQGDHLRVVNLIGKIHHHMGNAEAALASYQEVIHVADTSAYSHRASVLEEVAKANAGKINTYLDMAQNEPDSTAYLLKAWEASTHSLNQLDSLKILTSSDSSKQGFAKRFQPILEQSMNLAWQLFERTGENLYLQRAFEILERNKSYLLLQSVRGLHLARQYGVPDSLTRQEKSHSQWIAFYQQQIREESMAGRKPSTSKIELWEKQLLHHQQAITSLKIQFQSAYPAYFHSRYEPANASLSQVQDHLAIDSLFLLESFWGKDHLFLLGISSQAVDMISLPIDSSLRQNFYQLQRRISTFPAREESLIHQERLEFSQLSYACYRHLFSHWETEVAISKGILFIPDGPLASIPLETLITNNSPADAYHLLPYLVQSHNLQYAHSYTLWQEMHTARSFHRNNGRLLALAPDFSRVKSREDWESEISFLRRSYGVDTLSPLHWNQQEVRSIPGTFGNKLLVGTEANEHNFRREMGEFQILHLATHAWVHPSDPLQSCLFFSKQGDSQEDGQMSLLEMLGQKIEADLVVLSACETGLGNELAGEGVLSLSHSFAKSGASSVIASLWQVDDRSSSRLMEAFYSHLAQGKNQAEALRLARIGYLNTEERNNSPFFWGAWVVYGDTRPIVPDAGRFWEWVGWLALLGLGIFIWIWRRNRQTYSNT